MMLTEWAELLLTLTVGPKELDLRVADALGALFAGLDTVEGERLIAHCRGRDTASAAALASALARLSEVDDIHLPSCVTPGAIVAPVALAVSAEIGVRPDERFAGAVAAGYAAGIRLGLGVGGARALSKGVWPTLVCAPLMAAVTASILRGADAKELAAAMALSLSGRGGRIGRPMGNATSRWLAISDAVAGGVEAARAAAAGFEPDLSLISPGWLEALSGPDVANPSALDLARPHTAVAEVGYKPFATARQGANAIVAFRRLLDDGLNPATIERVLVEVPEVNTAMLSRTLDPGDRLSTLSNVGYQLALAAFSPDMLFDVARRQAPAPDVLAFAARVEVQSATDLAEPWPRLWPGRVTVWTSGREWRREVTELDTDAGMPSAEAAVRAKLRRQSTRSAQPDANYADGASRRAVWARFLDACGTNSEETLSHAHH